MNRSHGWRDAFVDRVINFTSNPVYLIVSTKSLLMLFAPKFDKFGCDVARAFFTRYEDGLVHGLCTGPQSVREHVMEKLGHVGGHFWHLEDEEKEWLLTPESTEELKRIERELGPGAFGRIVTADRRVGRGFVHGGLTRPDRIGRLVARNPDVGVLRYVNGLYRFLVSVLEETQPDVVFCYAVAGAPAVALAEICKARGIPFCTLTYTRMGSNVVVDSDLAGRLPAVARKFRQARDGHESFPPSALKAAREYLEAFRIAPVTPESMLGTSSHSRSAATRVARATLFLLHVLQEVLRGHWPGVEIARQLFRASIVWRRKFVGRACFSLPNDLPREFIYFPLHIDPEASTMVLSPWHTNQLAVIEALAKSAPAHMRVVVKEYSPMLGLRPRGFYQQIAKMPRAMILGPEHSSFDLIRKAALTAVITGTAAWEAILMGKQALIIGDWPFLPLGEGFVHEPDLTRLPQAIDIALALPPVSEEVLLLYIAALKSEAFQMSQSLLWGDYDLHPIEQQHSGSTAIADGIVRIMNNHFLGDQ